MRPGQVRDLSGFLPCDVFSRLSPATRRSQGSLPQVRHEGGKGGSPELGAFYDAAMLHKR
jgi:hypothetical protein